MTAAPPSRPRGFARTFLGGFAAGLALLFFAAAPSTGSASTLPPGFSEQVVLSGLVNPTVMRFAPDGRVFVGEKRGVIKEFDGLFDTTARVYADLRTNVHDYWDRGLLGLAVDPGFPTRNVVYALYTYDAPMGGTAPVYNDACGDATGAGCKVSGRLSRILPDGSEQVIIEDWCQQYPSHSIGSLAFGPDNKLYVSGGDGASFNWVDFGQGGTSANRCPDPVNEGGALRSQDMRTPPPADPANLNGAVLRIDPDTGAGVAGNPFASSSDANARRIIAYGLRNPFRIGFRPGTNELWVGDVGWNDWEEINRIPDATDATAENFGWPCYEGTARQPGYDNQNLPICETLYGSANAVTQPYFTYKHTDHVIAGEACPIGGSSATGVAFAPTSGGPYPAEYAGALFFSDYTRRCIWAMEKGGTQNPSPSNIKAFVVAASDPAAIEIGPDGNLYYVDISSGTVRRITYAASANQAPTAVAKADKTDVGIGDTVSFDASGSSDPDGDALSYNWDLDGDGVFGDSTAAKPTWTYDAAGNVQVSLRVSDGRGGVGSSALAIGVGLPKVTISTPDASLRWAVGDTVQFSGSAVDNRGAAIPAAKLSWQLVLKHGACPDCHNHFLETFAGVDGGSFTAPNHDYPSELQLSLTATDSGGLTKTVDVRLSPRTATASFATNPTGLKLTFNGTSSTAPFTRTVIVGSRNSLSAPTPQNKSGKQYFQSWSDGVRTAVHPDVVITAPVTYTATFSKTASSAPSNTSPPTVSGTARDGQVLTATAGGWSGSEPITYAYRWQRCDATGGSCADIAGATALTYSLGGSDVGATVRVRVTASNAAGAATATSAVTAVIAAAPPANTSAPTVAGTAQEGRTLTADRGGWSGTAPIAYDYQWQRCDSLLPCADIFAATAQTYTLSSQDVNSTVRVRVMATNAAGSAAATSAETAPVQPAAADTSPPTAPANFVATAATDTTIATSWNAASDNVGVAGYDVYVNGTKRTSVTATSYTFSGLQCGTSYSLGVAAYDEAGLVSSRTPLTASTNACPAAPTSGAGDWASGGSGALKIPAGAGTTADPSARLILSITDSSTAVNVPVPSPGSWGTPLQVNVADEITYVWVREVQAGDGGAAVSWTGGAGTLKGTVGVIHNTSGLDQATAGAAHNTLNSLARSTPARTPNGPNRLAIGIHTSDATPNPNGSAWMISGSVPSGWAKLHESLTSLTGPGGTRFILPFVQAVTLPTATAASAGAAPIGASGTQESSQIIALFAPPT